MTTLPTNVEFILAEDAAMKTKLEGIQLPSPRAGAGTVDVGVWYRWPQREYGDALFPFITIDLIGIEFDRERAHSYNYDVQQYISDTSPAAATPVNYWSPFPTPMQIMYLVAAHSRSARHDRMLFAKLLSPSRLPRRFGEIYVPTDDTNRRLDVLDITEVNEYDSLKKRVFRRMFTIGVSAEMTPEEVVTTEQMINNVVLDSMTSADADRLADPNYPII